MILYPGERLIHYTRKPLTKVTSVAQGGRAVPRDDRATARAKASGGFALPKSESRSHAGSIEMITRSAQARSSRKPSLPKLKFMESDK